MRFRVRAASVEFGGASASPSTCKIAGRFSPVGAVPAFVGIELVDVASPPSTCCSQDQCSLIEVALTFSRSSAPSVSSGCHTNWEAVTSGSSSPHLIAQFLKCSANSSIVFKDFLNKYANG